MTELVIMRKRIDLDASPGALWPFSAVSFQEDGETHNADLGGIRTAHFGARILSPPRGLSSRGKVFPRQCSG